MQTYIQPSKHVDTVRAAVPALEYIVGRRRNFDFILASWRLASLKFFIQLNSTPSPQHTTKPQYNKPSLYDTAIGAKDITTGKTTGRDDAAAAAAAAAIMASVSSIHTRSHSLLLLQKLLNLRDAASPLTLVLDSLEQPAGPLVAEFIARAKVRGPCAHRPPLRGRSADTHTLAV